MIRASWARRAAHRGQLGFSLIESLVTIALLGSALVALLGSLAVAVASSGRSQQRSQLELAAATVANWLESPDVAYRACNPGGSYATAGGAVAPRGDHVLVGVERPTGLPATRCGDNGLQRLTVTVSSGSMTSTRVVYKSAGSQP